MTALKIPTIITFNFTIMFQNFSPTFRAFGNKSSHYRCRISTFINPLAFYFDMTDFKRILKIEKNYEQKISRAEKKINSDLEKAKKELLLEEEALKLDYKKELNRELISLKKELKLEGEERVERAKRRAEELENSVFKDEVKKMLLEGLKNV